MPIYEYRCEEGHELEVLQRMTEDSLSSCQECGAPARRVLFAPAVHFKGSGFYTTDYAKKGKESSESDSTSASDTKTEKSEAASSPSKAASSPSESASSSSNGSGTSD